MIHYFLNTGCLEIPWKAAVDAYVTSVQSGITAAMLTEKYEKVQKALDLPPPFSVPALAESAIEQHSTSVVTAMLKAHEGKPPAEYVRLFHQILDI